MTNFTRIQLLLAMLALLLVAVPVSAAATAAPAPDSSSQSSADEAAKDDSRQSASERLAASSEFERGKLDGKAFGKDESSEGAGDAKQKESSSGGATMLRALLGLVVVLGAIFGVHWLLKRWGSSRMEGVAGRSGIIDVVATTSLAQGRTLHLVRVGSEMVLVGATEQSITRIGDVDINAISSAAGNAGKGEFQAMLNGAVYGQQPGVPGGMGGAGSSRDPFMRRFLDNLRMTTAR